MRHLIYACLVFSIVTNSSASKLPDDLNPLLVRTNHFLISEAEFMSNYKNIPKEEIVFHYTELVHFYHITRLKLFELIMKKRFNRELPEQFSRKVIESNTINKGKVNYTTTQRTIVDNFVFKSDKIDGPNCTAYFFPLLQEIYKNIQYAGFLMSGGYEHYVEKSAPPLRDVSLESYNAAVRGSLKNYTAAGEWLNKRIFEEDCRTCEAYAKFTELNVTTEYQSHIKMSFKLALEDYILSDWPDELKLLAAKCVFDERIYVMELARRLSPAFENIVATTMASIFVETLKIDDEATLEEKPQPALTTAELHKKLDLATALNEKYLAKAKEAIAQKETDKTEHNKQFAALKEKLSKLEIECNNQRLKIEAQNQHYEKELKATKGQLTKVQNKSSAAVENLKRDLEESKKQNSNLLKEMQTLKDSICQLEEGHKKTQSDQQSQIEVLQHQKDALDEEISNLKKQLNVSCEEVRMEKLKFASIRVRHDQNLKRLESLQATNQKLSQQVQEQTDRLKAQEKEIKTLEKISREKTQPPTVTDQTELQTRIAQQDVTIASLNTALQMLTDRANRAEARAADAERHLAGIYHSPLETLNCTWPFQDEQGTTHYLSPTEMHQAASAAVLAGFMEELAKIRKQQALGQ